MQNDTVYIAATDESSVEHIESLLDSLSYSVSFFKDEQSLVQTSVTNQPRFLLIDHNLEGVRDNGYQVAFDYANAHPETIIIALTSGPTDMLNRIRAAKSGASGLLTFEPTASELHSYLDDEFEFLNRQINVLIVDDSPTDGFSACRHLKKQGFNAEHIESPHEVLDACTRFLPDIIVSDFWMPECTGAELVKALRMDRRFSSLPIIYLSSEKDKTRQLDAMARGADEFLMKPVDPEYLGRTIENRVQRARKLRLLSERDSMSGLLNHAASLDALRFEMDTCGGDLTLAVLDLDHFKQVNDNYGHHVGDQVIRSFSALLKRNLGKNAIAGRHGGEEFIVIFRDTPMEEAYLALDKLRRLFCTLEHRSVEGESFTVSFSAGVVEYDGISQDLIHYADSALYEAKREGRNRVARTKISLPTASAV